MARIRVLDLAKELGIETKVAIAKLQELGISVKNHFNALSDGDATKLRNLYSKSKKTVEKEASQKAPSKLIIRRKVEQAPEAAEPETEIPVAAAHDDIPPSVVEDLPPPSVVPVEVEVETVVRNEKVELPPAIESHAPEKSQTGPVDMVENRASSESSVPTPPPQTSVASLNKEESQETPKPPPADMPPSAVASPVRKDGFMPAQIIRPAASQPPPARPASSPTGGGGGAVIVRRAADLNENRSYSPSSTSQGGRPYAPRPYSHGGGGQGGYSSGQQRDGGGQGQFRRPPGAPYQPREPGSSYGGGSSGAGGYRQGTGGGYPSPGGRGPAKPFAPAVDSTAPASKDMPSRLKDRDKDKDRDKRKTNFNESDHRAGKGGAKLKGGLHDEVDLDHITNFEEALEEDQVRTVIPNRRKPSSASLRRKEFKRAEAANPTKASKKVIRVDEFITVNDLASEMSQKATAVIKTLMKLGMMASINQPLDFDTASFVAQEFGFEVQNASVSIGDILAQKRSKVEDDSVVSRAPIVTIMGHVDHGKTSLLDAIRSAKVAEKELGGITQHIGAYQIEHQGRKLTFLDTPGHEAFTAMRARGAKVTDVVVLVVAADDGVMPQTIEAIAHAKAASVPIIVAINKIDKPGTNVERITRELSEQGVMPEEWGGEAMFVQVSAKTHQGIKELIEAILLQSDVLDLKAPKDGLAEGVVIEAKLDKARGPVATVIVTKGALNPQDSIVAGTCMGRLRAMFNDRGERLPTALPSTPIEIIGLDGVPKAGDTFNVVASEAIAKEAVAYRIEKQRLSDLSNQKTSSMEDIFAMMESSSDEKAKELPIIIKADTHGSAEAIKASIHKLDTPKVKTKVILSGVGGITETDVTLAKASRALVLGFNVRPDRMAAAAADQSGVKIDCFGIIYQLLEAVQAAMVGTLAPVKQDKIMGHAEIRNLFTVPKIGVIAGTMVSDGKVLRNSHVRIVRDGVVIYTGRVSSLKRFKDDAKEVLQGFECGIGVENYNDLKVGDVLESFIIEEIAASLT